MGFLGTPASNAKDIDLIVQLVIIVLLTVGIWLKKNKKIIPHAQLMTAAVIIHGGAIAFVMVPSLIFGFGAITYNPLGLGPLITVIHAIIGTLAWLYGVYLSWIWRNRPTVTECFKRKKLMKPVLYAWLAAAALGVSFYIYYYVI